MHYLKQRSLQTKGLFSEGYFFIIIIIITIMIWFFL